MDEHTGREPRPKLAEREGTFPVLSSAPSASPGDASGRAFLRERIVCVSCYFGLAPVMWLSRRQSRRRLLDVHCRQALSLFALLALVLAVLLALVFAYSYGLVCHRSFFEGFPAELWLFSAGRKLFIVWGVFWLYAAGSAAMGSETYAPYISVVARRRWVQHTGCVVALTGMIFFVALSSLAWLASRQASASPSQGRVFVVYDDMEQFPRGMFALAAYRIVRASIGEFGPESAVLLPLTRDNINTSLAQGTLVFLGTHGTARGLMIPEGYYTPGDVPSPDRMGLLRYVYLAGCDSGALRQAWEEALYPASVKTYDRLTPTLEHLWWLWTEGPRLVEALARE